MSIDSAPSFNQPPIENITISPERKNKLDQATELVDLVFENGINLQQEDRNFIENNDQQISSVNRGLEEIKYGEPGFDEVFKKGRDIVETINSQFTQLKYTSENFQPGESEKENLYDLMDQISKSNDEQEINELAQQAKNIFMTNINKRLDERNEIQRHRNILTEYSEENSQNSRSGLFNVGENLGREINSGNVYEFVISSKKLNDSLEDESSSLRSKEFNYRQTLEESYFKFLNKIDSLTEE